MTLLGCLFLVLNQSYAQLPTEQKIEKAAKHQPSGYGIKLGYNIAKLTGSTPSFSPRADGGFHVSAFYAPSSKGMGYRTELVFSRQSFAFDEDGTMQNVQQDYVFMPHLTTFTIAKVLQLQAGGQIGYLLNAKKEAESKSSSEDITEFMNRLDYGAALGVEIYPFKGLILGARYNVSVRNPYKEIMDGNTSPTPQPFPMPVNPNDFKGKNAVVQISAGYRF